MLSEFPADASKRDGVLDGAHYQPGPEQHAKLAPKERKAETVAATAAAVIGSMFSTTQNVTLGSEVILDPVKPVRARPGQSSSENESTDTKPAAPVEPVRSDKL